MPHMPLYNPYRGLSESKIMNVHTPGSSETGTTNDASKLPVENNPTLGSDTVIDPVENVKGMYRLLDLICEPGSNGYVDKIVVAQGSLQRFINAISPGAYASITRVDFKRLDRLLIRPLGVYGSKDEIAHLLRSIGAVDESGARSLLNPTDTPGPHPGLSSGLYIVRADPTTNIHDERHYVIYWPEDSTWNDSAASSVRRNRVTFMRYLTKLCDQVVVLLSPEHSASIVWNDDDSDNKSVDVNAGDSDRLFTFEVSKKNEQEENAVARPGFQMHFRHIPHHETPRNCPVNSAILVPRLLSGETTQGILTAIYTPRQIHTEVFNYQSFTHMSLEQMMKDNALVLPETLDENAVQTLLDLSILDGSLKQCNKWHAAKREISDVIASESTERQRAAFEKLASKEDQLQRALRDAVVGDVVSLFPSLESDHLCSYLQPQEVPYSIRLSDIEALYPESKAIYECHFRDAKFDNALSRKDFQSWKLRLVSVRHLRENNRRLRAETWEKLANSLLEGDFNKAERILQDNKKYPAMLFDQIVTTFGALFRSTSSVTPLKGEMKALAAHLSDSQFLREIKIVEDKDLQPAIKSTEALAYTIISPLIDKTVKAMTHAVVAMQQEHCRKSIQHEIEHDEMSLRSAALANFIREVNAQQTGKKDSVLYLSSITATPSDAWGHIREYWITGRREAPNDHSLQFRVHPMDLTSDDEQNMRLNPKHVPNPTVNHRLSYNFNVPIGMDVAFCQILENEKLLLVLLDQDRAYIYLERLPTIDMVIQRGIHVKHLDRKRLGEDVLFAFNETKRALAVCGSKKLQLHLFTFDETFKMLQRQGGAIDLAPWYSQATISILKMAFISGRDDVVLVDSNNQARVFSFVTLQFRPAPLRFLSLPDAIFSSPDGSCLLTLHSRGSQPSLTVYHWESFGSTHGIPLDIPEFSLKGAVLTSMVSRGCLFLVSLDIDTGCIRSIAIDVTKKVTEYIFKKKGSRNVQDNEGHRTLHNSLLDCHPEVWTRFPVVPAVERRTVRCSSERQQKAFTFITENHMRPFDSYFSDLIQTFERMVRKPTGEELRRIKVSAVQPSWFKDHVVLRSEWNVSRYRVGEWLVDLLCLIPIHIAVCRENRFIPLADGVFSPALERSLLGAEVNQIVDKLSFGWYESIFQSYLATKPVKVVSSMGQQSVGKSFSLNHLLDTSFAGSAMRTTEGVWMSVTPTDETLIVSLDFEGVDSIERSFQEDTLLVLFNTAISNLVLFRNNFAFSRDISGHFQSFQSSASVLDPAANPSLFQSTLVIIIKDVIDTDRMEIVDEFSLKFQKIVEQEQDSNFISRLHGGKLSIIPWPVIKSKEFYKEFSTLKKHLDLQKTSHKTAGQFLHTIKTLMAKLKANDWGALSQTMAEHRVRTLSTLLPIALATGYSEVAPDFEPLKNLDTDLIVEGDDTKARFALSECEQKLLGDIESCLTTLRESWNHTTERQLIPDPTWMENLASYISGLINLRVNHVRVWLGSNLERFQTGHAVVEDLHRQFNNMVIEIHANVQLCGAHCKFCHLLCVRNRLHEGDHNCQTAHNCVHPGGYEHSGRRRRGTNHFILGPEGP